MIRKRSKFYNKMAHTPHYKMKEDARTKIDKLMKSIIRQRYAITIGFTMMAQDVIDDKMNQLTKLENLFPSLKRNYSPTNHDGFVENFAKTAFGDEDWEIIKETMLLMEKTHYDGYDH